MACFICTTGRISGQGGSRVRLISFAVPGLFSPSFWSLLKELLSSSISACLLCQIPAALAPPPGSTGLLIIDHLCCIIVFLTLSHAPFCIHPPPMEFIIKHIVKLHKYPPNVLYSDQAAS